MRIALFSDGIYPYVIGGIQKHSFYLAKQLAGNGVDVDIYVALDPHIKAKPPEQLLTPQERSHLRWIPVQRPRVPKFPGHYLRCSYLVSQELLRAYQGQRSADFIYSQGLTGWAAIREKRRGQPLPPLGINPHGLEMFQRPAGIRPLLENWMMRPSFRWLLKHADVVLSLGGGVADIMRNIGVDGKRIIESPNGVGRHWLVPDVDAPAGPTRFVFIGRCERRKGVKELKTVLARLCGRYEFTCQFIGPIPESLRLTHPSVTYWGPIQEERRVQEILRGSDILVLPSYSEGMPTVILEAMASGVAVIATKVGAVDAMVSEANGWLIPPGNVEALERALVDTMRMAKPDLRKKKTAARRLVEQNFTWEVVGEKTRQEIEGVLRQEAIVSAARRRL